MQPRSRAGSAPSRGAFPAGAWEPAASGSGSAERRGTGLGGSGGTARGLGLGLRGSGGTARLRALGLCGAGAALPSLALRGWHTPARTLLASESSASLWILQ